MSPMLIQKRSKSAKRKALRLGSMSVISFLVASLLMCWRHEGLLWGSVGFAFMGVILMYLAARARVIQQQQGSSDDASNPTEQTND